MAISDLYESGEHKRNVAHFAAIVTLAKIDGDVNEEELAVLNRFARKLDITETEFTEVLKSKEKFPINPPASAKKRLHRLYDLLSIVFADHEIDDQELHLVTRYAVGLGFPSSQIDAVLKRSIAIFSGKISFDDYHDLMEK